MSNLKRSALILALSLAVLVPAFSQTITITQPAGGTPTIAAATTAYPFTVTLASAPSVDHVCYTVDSYAAVNPGADGNYITDAWNALGCIGTAPYSYNWNPFWTLNGTHQVIATAYDALGNILTCSSAGAYPANACTAVPFITANAWPVTCTPVLAVSTSIALTSNWSGFPTVTATISGPCATDTMTMFTYIDGIFQGLGNFSSGTVTRKVDTASFTDSVHAVCLTVDDQTNGISYGSNLYVGAAAEWCRNVTFQNGATAMETRENSSKIYLSSGGTYQLSPSVVNTNGSAGSPAGYAYQALQSAELAQIGVNTIATVNSTGLVTAVANGWAQILTMAQTCSGSDLAILGSLGITVFSTTDCPLNSVLYVGRLITITSGTGFTPGTYRIVSMDTRTTGPSYAILDRSCASAGSSGGVFNTGPTSVTDVFVWSSNVTAYFGSDGATHTTYNASVAQAVHSMFASLGLIETPGPLAGGGSTSGDQPYNAFGGALAQYAASGINTFETGAACCTFSDVTPDAGSYGAFKTSTDTATAAAVALLGSYPNLRLYLFGTAFANNAPALYGSASTGLTYGLSPAPAFQYTIQSWASRTTSSGARSVVALNMLDEGNANGLGNYPLQGPINFTNSNVVQNWMYGGSITASGGGGSGESCLATIVNGPYAFMFAPSTLGPAGSFIISGSSIPNMNNTGGQVYNATASGNNFTFPCANVADGVYNGTAATNCPTMTAGACKDLGLTINANAYQWVSSNTGFVHYDNFATMKSQQLAASPTMPMSMSVIGDTGCAGFANWNGNSSQSIGAITQFGDYTEMYTPNGTVGYIAARWSAYSILTVNNMGNQLRSRYGCYNPALPLLALTQGTLGYVGLSGTPVTVASASGNTITFSGPHGIKNILYGITRLQITGATDTGSPTDSTNNNFFIDTCPTPTTCTVLLGASDFISTGTGGTLTWQDGTTEVLTAISTTGNLINCGGGGYLCGDSFTYSGGSNPHQERKRGQTFTFSVQPTGSTAPTPATIGASNVGTYSAFNSYVISGGNNTFIVTVNGGAPQTVTLGSGTRTPAGIVNDINAAAITGLTASAPNGGTPPIVLTASVSGGVSSILIGSGTANATIGFTNGQSSKPCLNTPCNWSRTFELLRENLNVTSTSNTAMWFREVPVLSSTGGTAVYTIDNNYHKGITPSTVNPVQSGQEGGSGDASPDWVFGEVTECIIFGCAGERVYQTNPYLSGYWDQYGFAGSYTYTLLTNFNLGLTNTNNHLGQVATHQFFEYAQSSSMWHAHNSAALMWNSQLKYIDQPKLNAPDYGEWIECGARGGSYGDLLICLNVTDGAQTRTFVFDGSTGGPNFLQGGQKIVRYVANAHGITMSIITAGTTTDTLTLQPLDSVWYTFPVTFATELLQPVVSIKLVGSAVRAVAHCTYDPYYVSAAPIIQDLGTGSGGIVTTQLNMNSNIGTIYCRFPQLDSSNKVLAGGINSAVQQF